MTTLAVQKDRLLFNYRTVCGAAGVPVIPVLKGNAYGLGEIPTAKLLFEAGAKTLAVARLEEAERLAAALPPDAEIFLTTPYDDEDSVRRIIAAGITATAGSDEGLVLLGGIAQQCGVTVRVHLAFDTGMGRFGFLPEEASKAAQTVKYLKNIQVAGCFSHLSNCFGRDKKGVKRQLDLLQKCVEAVRREEVEPGMIHLANSAAAISCPSTRLGVVRVGSALLGRVSVKNHLGLKRVGRLESEICEVRWLPPKHNIGYANTFKTKHPMRVAIIPVGYADGLFSEKRRDTFRFRDILRFGFGDLKLLFGAGRLFCEIGGKRAPIVGRIGLCNVEVDVTNLEGIKPGDIAVFDVNPLYVNANVERSFI